MKKIVGWLALCALPFAIGALFVLLGYSVVFASTYTALAMITLFLVVFVAAQNGLGGFTKIEFGEIAVVMLGSRPKLYIGKGKDFWVHPKNGEVNWVKDGRLPPVPSHIKLPEPWFLGYYWIGFPFIHSLHKWKFRWTDRVKNKATGKYELVTKAAIVQTAFAQAQYTFKLEEIETRDGAVINGVVSYLVRMEDMERALFGIKSGWLETLEDLLASQARDFLGKRNVESLSSFRKTDDSDEDLANEFEVEMLRLNKELSAKCGVKLHNVAFPEYDVVDDKVFTGNSTRLALQKKMLAQKNLETAGVDAQTTTTKATADAEARRIKAKGDADAKTAEGGAANAVQKQRELDLAATKAEEARLALMAKNDPEVIRRAVEATQLQGTADAEVVRKKGLAEAEGVKAKAEAIKGNREVVGMAFADAMKETKAKSIVFGGRVLHSAGLTDDDDKE